MFGDNTEEETLNCLTTNTCNTTHQYSNSGTKTIYLQTQEMPPRTQTVYDRARVYVYKLGYNVFAEINNPNAISLDPGIHTLEGTNSYAAQCFDTSEACSGTCYQSGDLTCKDIESPTLTYEWIVNSEVETNKTSSINRVFIQPGTQNITLKVGYTPAGSTQIFDEDKIFFFIGRGGAFCSSTTSGSEWMDYSDNTLQTFDSLNDCFGTNSGIGTVIGRTDCCPLGRYSCSQVGECELTAEELCEDFTDEESCINSTSLAIRELTDAGEFCGITEESSEGGVLTFEEIECLCIWENNECKAVQESKRYNFNDITHPTDGGSCTWDNTEWTEDCDISNKITATWKAILTPNSEGYVSEELKDTCVDNSKEISCEGIVKLNFFTTINLIITLLSIITIYSFMFSKE